MGGRGSGFDVNVAGAYNAHKRVKTGLISYGL
jgi:hypothetical protein